MVRRLAVDPVAPRQLTAPLLVVPVAVANPRSFRHSASELADATREVCRRPRISKLYGREAETAREKMNMRVYESWNHEHATSVYDANIGVHSFHNFGAGADDAELFARC
jgi:hypothetical protein